MDCTIRVAKTEELISFAVTAKLICVFVYAYAKSRFSHDPAHMGCIVRNHVFCIWVNQRRISAMLQRRLISRSVGSCKMSRVVRKPAFCICENKDADQLGGNRKADQRLCFRYIDSTISLLPKYEISGL